MFFPRETLFRICQELLVSRSAQGLGGSSTLFPSPPPPQIFGDKTPKLFVQTALSCFTVSLKEESSVQTINFLQTEKVTIR